MKPALPPYFTTTALVEAFNQMGDGEWDTERVLARLRHIHPDLAPVRSARGGRLLVDTLKIRDKAPSLYQTLLLLRIEGAKPAEKASR